MMSDKYRVFSASLAILSAALLSACATNLDTKGYQPMSAAAIKQAMSGNTLYTTGFSHQTHWQWAGYYRPDGTAHGLAWWHGGQQDGKGTWEVTSNGRMCEDWNNNWNHGKHACFRYFRKGDVIISKAATEGVESHKLTLEKGNPYKL